jgi:hypothetical protein
LVIPDIFFWFFYFVPMMISWGAIPMAIQDVCWFGAATAAIARGNFEVEWYSNSPTLYGNSGRELSGYCAD